jgi:uncharacterized membrane protein YjgN (DUF898 family)
LIGVVPPVGRITWLVLALNLVSCFGSGLTKPFLDRVRRLKPV